MFKRIALGLALILGIFVAVTLYRASQYPDTLEISRHMQIEVPPEQIYPWIVNLQKWEKWSPWIARDPSVQNTYAGPEEGVGAKQSWTSEKSGSGSLELVDAVPNKSVSYELTFVEWDGVSHGSIELESTSDGTKATWSMASPLTFGAKIFYVVFQMEEAIAKDFEDGLARLTSLAESRS